MESHMCLKVHPPIRDDEDQGSSGSQAHGHPWCVNQSENEPTWTIWFSLPKEEETQKAEFLLNDENGEVPHLDPQ